MSDPIKLEDVQSFKAGLRQRFGQKATFHVKPEILAMIKNRAETQQDNDLSRVVKRMFDAGENDFVDRFIERDEGKRPRG